MSRYEFMMIDQFHACSVAPDEEAFTRFFGSIDFRVGAGGMKA